jgi:hypothetical protein
LSVAVPAVIPVTDTVDTDGIAGGVANVTTEPKEVP